MREEYIKKIKHRGLFPLNDFSGEQYLSLLKKYLPQENNLTDNQKTHFDDIVFNLEAIYHALKIFDEINFPYTLAISGGAVYDTILDLKNIKDHDIILFFKELNLYQHFANETVIAALPVYAEKKLRPLFNQFNIIKEYYDVNDLSYLINLIISNSFNVSQVHYVKAGQCEEYLNHAIIGMVKIKDTQLAKPIDLIISKSSVYEYIHTFDFDLCKSFIEYQKDSDQQFNILDNLFIMPASLKDMDNKTLTLNLRIFNQENIHYFLNKHYLKIKQKLPQFNLALRNQENQEEKVNYIQAILIEQEKNFLNQTIENHFNDDNQADKKTSKVIKL